MPSSTVEDYVKQIYLEQLAAGGVVLALTQQEVDSWIDRAVHALHVQAAAIDQPVRELACTLVVALLGKDGHAYFQLGDGAIVAMRAMVSRDVPPYSIVGACPPN